MPEYTVAAVVAPLLVVALELAVLRTGLLRTARYWLTIAIVMAFQVPVDGWLTRREATVVHYQDAASSGVHGPWQVPAEDFGFGFAMVTLTLLLWRRYAQRAARPAPAPAPAPAHAPAPAAAPAPAPAADRGGRG